MSDTRSPIPDADQPVVYQIRLKGHLSSQWLDWFDGLTITPQEDGTLVNAPGFTAPVLLQDLVEIQGPRRFVVRGRNSDMDDDIPF